MDFQDKSKEELISEIDLLRQECNRLKLLHERDIENLKLADEQIIADEFKYARLTENMNDVIWEVNLDLTIKYISKGIQKVTGFYPSEMIGKNLFRFFEPQNAKDLRNTFSNRMETLKETGDLKSAIFKHHQLCKNGEYKWLEALSNPILDKNKNLLGFQGISRDISELQRVDEALRLSEERLSKIYHSAPYVITLLRISDLRLIEVNQVVEEVIGFTREEILEKPSLALYIWVDLDKRNTYFESINNCETLRHFEFRFKTKDGEIGTALMSTEYLTIEDELCVLGFFEVITERKNAEIMLQEKNKEIAAQNEDFLKLNEELLQSNEELRKAKDKAEESDRLKTAFLQNMSHEIRTPMNAIMGFSSLLTKQIDNREKLDQYADIINQRCYDLLEIIDDILDIAKIESGQLSSNIEECDLNLLFLELQSIFKEHQHRTQKDHIQFKLTALPDKKDNIILTDKGKLKQIFINLIGNAFKFTDFGKIEGRCKIENNFLLFYLSDTGIGIPKEKHQSIFERFVQLNQSAKKIYGGTGLGLSIVKGLVELLGGKIWLESEPGKGTCFYFTIPYKTTTPKAEIVTNLNECKQSKFKGSKVLIVEDDIFNSEYLKEVLFPLGLSVTCTESGKEAIKLALNNDYDIILMDILLPDIDGYEVTKKIIQNKPGSKIIAQTAYASYHDKQIALGAGCTDHISKPIDHNALVSMLKKHLVSIG